MAAVDSGDILLFSYFGLLIFATMSLVNEDVLISAVMLDREGRKDVSDTEADC